MSAIIFLQLAVILAATQLAVAMFSRLRQPPVIAQLIAGVVVGQSVLGAFWPSAERALFSTDSLGVIQVLGLIGVALYMFQMGSELDLSAVRRGIRTGVGVSLVGIGLPLVVGFAVAWPFAGDHRFFVAGVPPVLAAMFFAAAIAVTAFPVMAAIISGCGLQEAPFATLALVCGCLSDAVAWGLVAIVVGTVSGRPATAVTTLGGSAALAIGLLVVLRPLLHRFGAIGVLRTSAHLRLDVLGLIPVMAVSWLAESIGVHPAFGGFLLGTAMPRSGPARLMGRSLDGAAANLLLPLYFVYAGLHARLSLISSADLVVIAAAVVVVATVTKGVGCGLAARLTGLELRESAAVGALMNARGLVELVVITIGLERHVITPTLYSILVTMTIVTTLMATPALRLLFRDRPQRAAETPAMVHSAVGPHE